MSSRRKAVAAVAAIMAGASAWAADDLPGLSLQLSRQLSPRAHTVDETEQALLRVEWKAAQSNADETVAVEQMLARLDRIGQSVAQLREQLAAAPTPRPSLRRLSADPNPVAPASATPSMTWLAIVGGIAALSLIAAFRLRRRRTPLMEETTFEPMVATQTAVLPGTPGTGPALTLAPPTIASPPAPFEDDEPAIEFQQPPAEPPEDGQIPLELADILLSMNLAEGAARALEVYIREHPHQALCHWLKLLDVYRRANREAEFEEAAAELHLQFNVAPTDWQPPDAATPAFTLESYPHIRSRLQTLWRRRSCAEYLNQLLADNRGGTRTGFPQPVVEEILFLQAILRG